MIDHDIYIYVIIKYVYLYSRYFLYTRTRVGYYYHQRDIAKAKEKLKNVGGHHSNLTPFDYGGEQLLGFCLVVVLA